MLLETHLHTEKTDPRVGADGLGNPDDNTLPICQLRRLQRLVNEVQDPHQAAGHCFWWCDTLCVPVHPQDLALRKKAIVDMRRIYQKASTVLALDNTLLKISRATTILEIYLRLKLSAWMRRLWTLQEAILPSEVHIQFSDGTRTIRNIASALQEQSQPHEHLYLRYTQLSDTFFAPLVGALTGDASQSFSYMWKQLQWRSTSHASDETICLATILGLDVQRVLAIPHDQPENRMVKLLQMMGRVPLLLPFQRPPRLTAPGFRWAPATFLNCFRPASSNPFRVLSGVGDIPVDGKGLCLERKGFEITDHPEDGLAIGQDFLIAPHGRPDLVLGVTYKWPEDCSATNHDGTLVIKKPALIYLAVEAKPGEPLVLGEILGRDEAAGIINVAFVAVVIIISASLLNFGARPHREVTHQAIQVPDATRWLLY